MHLAFEKYCSNGNHFVLIDETVVQNISDGVRSSIARYSGNSVCGAGADSIIFLQPPTASETFWPHPRHSSQNGWIARFFEPSGAEFLTCGNGLACIARYLFDRYGQAEAKILVEVPSHQPNWCEVAWDRERHEASVRLTPTLQRIRDFADPGIEAHEWNGLLLVGSVPLTASPSIVSVSGVLAYTGEPHMVLFQLPDGMIPPRWPTPVPWIMDFHDLLAGDNDTFSLRLAGIHANRHLRKWFPKGINLVFARPILMSNQIEYRCFERGLEYETLACGTGALAAALAARQLGLTHSATLRLLPSAARRNQRFKQAEIGTTFYLDGSMALSTRADHVFSGIFTAVCLELTE